MLLTVMCLNIGTSEIINFPFWTNRKIKAFSVPVLNHFGVNLISL